MGLFLLNIKNLLKLQKYQFNKFNLMKNLLVFASVLVLFAACSSGGKKSSPDVSIDDIKGKWVFTNFEDPKDKYKTEITECDKLTVWEFTDKKAEPLDDGTETYHLIVTAPDTCEWYDFESKWTVTKTGDIFISSSRIGGMGGMSNAGKFDLEELTDTKMVLEIMDCLYTFERK
jgi:hypothetical protein